MNKVFANAVVGLALGAVSAVSALDLSVGGGGFFASDFGGGVEYNVSVAGAGEVTSTTKTPYYGGGLNLFFDLAFAEVSIGYFMGGGEWETEVKSTIVGQGSQSQSDKFDFSASSINLGLLGKYPIALSDAMTVFPAVGIDYLMCISAKLNGNDEEEPGDLSALAIKFGAGLDFGLSDKLFLRSELLYGIRLASTFENDLGDLLKAAFQGLGTSETRLGHGLTVKVGIGFKL